MSAGINITGMRFGILNVLAIAPRPPNGQGRHWSCKCDCGKHTVARAKDLRNGNTASCGCLKPGRGGNAGRHRTPVLDLNRPWRKSEHVDDRWLVALDLRSPVGAGA